MSRKSKRGENPLLAKDISRHVSQEGTLAKDIVLKEAERQLYQHKMPEIENDMGNMMQEHEEGSTFPNVAILDEPPDTLESRYRKLMQLQPRMTKRRMDVPDHVTVKLRKEVEEFTMSEIVKLEEGRKKTQNLDYVLIKRAALILSPLSSFIDNHSDVLVSIVDTRKRSNQVTRSLRLQDNKLYRGEFVLDYSFPKESSNKVSLSFAQEVPTFDTGEQWAVCQIFLDMEESDFPQTVAFQESIGQAAVTTSMLQEYKFHPGHLDVAIRDSHIGKLRELYRRGEIIDDTEPKSDRKLRSAYAKSGGELLKQSRGGRGKIHVGSTGSVDWNEVRRGKMPEVPAYQASVEPADCEEVEETTQEKIARMNMLMNSPQQQEEIPTGKLAHHGRKKPPLRQKKIGFLDADSREVQSTLGSLSKDNDASGSSDSVTTLPVRLGPMNVIENPIGW